MVYHYTTMLHLPFILESGVLKPSRRTAHGDHRFGLLWFSRNVVLERTSLKGNAPLVRFGIPDGLAEPWRKVAREAGYTSGVMRRLERNGRKKGARPSDWLALRGALSIDQLPIEIHVDGAWRILDRSQLGTVRRERGLAELRGPGGLAAVVGRVMQPDGVHKYGTSVDALEPRRLLHEGALSV